MASQLSDEDLRSQLKLHGVNVGPITVTTRRLWERKLDSVLEQEKRRQGEILTASSKVLNALSSDDSEVDLAGNFDRSRNHKKKRNSLRHISIGQARKFDLNISPDTSPSSDVFKKPFAVSQASSSSPVDRASRGKRNSDLFPNTKSRKSFLSRDHSLNTTFDVETSDSDFDSDALLKPMRTLRLRKQVNTSPKKDTNSIGRFRNHEPDLKDFTESNDTKVGQKRTPNRRSSEKYLSHFTGSKLLKDGSYSANGYVPDAILNGDFPNTKSTGHSTNYSHCVSWMLVLGMAAFFVIIGVVYMSAVQKTSLSASLNHLAPFKCEVLKKDHCIPEDLFNSVLLVSRELHTHLSAIAGEYECQNILKSRRLTLLVAKAAMKEKFANQFNASFEKIFNHAMYLTQKNPDWGIRLFANIEGEERQVGSEMDISLEHISALEAVQAAKSFWCRLQHSIRWTTSKLIILSLVVAFICLIVFCIRLWKKKEEAQEKQFCELVDKIIGILQESDDSTTDGMPCKAIVHIRDMLIPPKERKEKQWLWDKAVAFIEENESRVRVEYQQIAGENHKMWRWLSTSTPEVEGGKYGKVWQGQAFGSLGKGKNNMPYSPTPCLKIRNMFDSEIEYGEDWRVCIQDAILEKCEGNDGIVHIAVDTSTDEGCVYMMCNSTEASGKAFTALHGWWFDGKLVTVKYLRLERYLERFPEAEHCNTPLKPSNNKRLSLSAPFFSSALERS